MSQITTPDGASELPVARRMQLIRDLRTLVEDGAGNGNGNGASDGESKPSSSVGVARRLGGVDGLRAFAALWVVLFHIRAFSGVRLHGVPGLDLFARSGSTGVSLFLVLSGFCLYLPYAAGRASRFATRSFLFRRCRRLLPAYYASLILIVVAILAAQGRVGLEHLDAGGAAAQIATHVSLTHQFFPSTFFGLNGAYWTLGLEWELYLTLPLLIVGVRRIGVARTVVAVVAVNVAYRLLLVAAIDLRLIDAHGALAKAVLPNLFLGRWAEFAFGMLAAECYAKGRIREMARRMRYCVIPFVAAALLFSSNPLSHLIFGAAFFSLFCVVLADDNFVARVFSWPPLVTLGVMSYSIYLVHQPLVQVGADVLGAGRGTSATRVFVELLLLLPVLLLAAWLLFITVERRTLTPGSLNGGFGRSLRFPATRGMARSGGSRLVRVARPRHVDRGATSPDNDEQLAAPIVIAPGVLTPEVETAAMQTLPPRRSLGINISALAASQVVTWSVSLLWTLVVPRRLGPAGMGILVTAWSATGILAVVMGLGTKNFLVREIVARPEQASALVGTAMVLRACLVPVFVVGIALYASLAGFSSEEKLVLYLATGAMALTLLAEVLQAAFQAVERMEYLAYSDVFLKTVQCGIGIGLAIMGFGPVSLTATWMCVSGLVLLLNLWWVRPLLPIELHTDLRRVRSLITESLPYWAFGLFFMVYLWIDSVMLGLMTREEVVGWYGVPTKLFTTLMFVPVILSTAWLPRLVSAFEQGADRLRALARAPVELVVILSLPLCVGTAMTCGPVIRALYGPNYDHAVPVMIILALCIPPMYLNVMLNQVLVASNRQAQWTWVMLAATVVNPLLNFALIRATESRFDNGAIGAAASLVLTEIIIVGVGIWLVGRQTLNGASLQRLGRATLAALTMWAAMYAARPLGFVASVAAGGLSFLISALLLRVATSEELEILRAGLVWLRRSVVRVAIRLGVVSR